MERIDLNIIIVGYNEEINLPKCFEYLKYIRSKIHCRIIYIDQTSNDKSVEIASKNGAEIYVHPNKGYADPDKKWAVEELCQKDDWCMILDCDEEITKELSDEIINGIKSDEFELYFMYRKTIFLGGFGGEAIEKRLFKKYAMKVTDEIHNYLHPQSDKIKIFKSRLIQNDIKEVGKEIFILINKMNKYSEIEIKKMNISLNKAVFLLFFMPILRFGGFMIKHKQIFRGKNGLIISLLNAFYQFLIYAKYIEKIKTKK